MSQQESVSYHIKTAKTKNSKAGKTLDIAYLRVTKRENGSISRTSVSESSSDIVHPDLLSSLKPFLPHFLILGEREKLNKFQPSYFNEEKWKEEGSTYEVTGIHIKESNEKQFVIMVGRQNLKSGRVISMVIPMVCFDPNEEDEDVYPLHSELKKAVEGYLNEVELFISGKVGESDQKEIDFNKKTEEETEEEPEKKTKVKLQKVS